MVCFVSIVILHASVVLEFRVLRRFCAILWMLGFKGVRIMPWLSTGTLIYWARVASHVEPPGWQFYTLQGPQYRPY